MMDSDTEQHHFSLIESIPPSADLHLAATPFFPTLQPQSPTRRQRSTQHELGPYLRDLEPSLLLEALIAKGDASSARIQKDEDGRLTRQAFIRNAVAGASLSEREWGIKTAKASKSIRQWYDELARWPWPKSGDSNGFGAQYQEDQLALAAPPSGLQKQRSSIPLSELRAHEMRVEDIKKDLGMLELEDLKGYVRDVHVTPNSKRALQESSPHVTSYEHMDDLQAMVTAAILQSLPTLARLNALLNAWSLRLVIMRLIPDFMRDMTTCKDSLISAQMATGGLTSQNLPASQGGSTRSSQRESFSRKVFGDMQAVLKDQVSQTGQKLDAMLDLLDGSADVLPEQWIDSMDDLEEQLRSWAKKAEEVVQDYESHQSRASVTSSEQVGTEFDKLGNQQLKSLSRGSRTFSNSTNESDHDIIDTSVPWVAMSPSNGSGLYSPHMNTITLARNVSIGVRKPTGVPPTGNTESTQLAVALDQGVNSDEQEDPHVEHDPTPDLLDSRSLSGSEDSDSVSIGSSPEIQNATLAAYPGSPIQVTTPATSRPSVDYLNISQNSDLHYPRSRMSWGGMPSENRHLKHERRRSSTFTASTSPSPGGSAYLHPENGMLGYSPDHARPRSASMKSFEIVRRSEVRTIEVRRSRDSSRTPSLQKLGRDERSTSPISKIDLLQQESLHSGSSSDASLLNLTTAKDRFMLDEIPLGSHLASSPEALRTNPMRMSIAKTRNTVEKESSAASRIPKAAQQKRAATMNNAALTGQSQVQLLSNGDRLDARINTILTNIPADIRLTSSAEAASPANGTDSSAFTKSRTSHLSRLSVSRLLRSKASAPTTPPATLTRAVPSVSSEPRINGSSDIKLYHLHRPGSAHPIKLYIRLVGDTGERVMVRVGGGWADLAEYLKEYASHHGKRAVSDNHFNIQNIPIPSSSSSSPANSRPSSSSSAAIRRQPTTPTAATPNSTPGMALSSNPPFPPRTPTSSGSQPPFDSTSTTRNRTWSANNAGFNAYDTEVSPTPGLGLAGPKTKNVNISPRKQAWVDGMMRQARRTSVGGSDGPGSEKGVKGGVRRVLLGRSGGRKE